MNAEGLMMFLMCMYIPIGVVACCFAIIQILGWFNE
jgi:hypothetical protein